MKRIMNLIFLTASTFMIGASLTSCATISQEQCLNQSPEDIGYMDGSNGKSRERFNRLAKTCAKHGVSFDRTAYLRGFEKGLPQYCVYENGYSRGVSGNSPNKECRTINADNYLSGYQDGYVVYKIEIGHTNLIQDYDRSVTELAKIRRALEEDELTSDERKRYLKQEIRLEDQREEIRFAIRDYEQTYDLPRYYFIY